jgi:SAM-dependent methyltransferase
MTVETRWSAKRVADLIQAHRDRRSDVPREAHRDGPLAWPASSQSGRPSDDVGLLHRLTWPDHHEFVDNAYRVLLGRPPTPDEYVRVLAALLNGEAKTWLLGALLYSAEGRAHGTAVLGLRPRYLAHKLFHLRVIGPVFEWLNAILRLPRSIRMARATAQIAAGNALDTEHTVRMLANDHFAGAEAIGKRSEAVGTGPADLEQLQEALNSEVERLTEELAVVRAHADAVRSRLDAFLPPRLGETFEIEGSPLVEPVRERIAVPAHVPTSQLSRDIRYALFQAAFYDSAIVATKQRVYLPYISRDLASRYPFLDLGCGRGEFLRILAGEGIRTIGVDVSSLPLEGLRATGFEVVEQDLLDFLASDRRTFSGASVLQVAEHLAADEIEQMLSLLAARLAPGAALIVETPNPLSPFALGQFHTDPTHVAPIPPERLRFTIEAAGFERTRTLFQALVPGTPFMGPDPRAYYMDYAIIAYRSSP